ncbi:putative nuclear and mitochondrial base-excision repair protein [Sordaria sp. MPI-SDFR-AT-0083]|nr:putative nuclear and mitochondrial base-excision repair protein [Sordaria sp. MPI-SDFR-AT-0083]
MVTPATPRRSTRLSTLARFAYEANNANASSSSAPADLRSSPVRVDEEHAEDEDGITFGSDIEDAVKSNGSPAVKVKRRNPISTRKRKATVLKNEEPLPAPTRIKTERKSTRIITQTAEAEVKSDSEIDMNDIPAVGTSATSSKKRTARKPARKTTDALTGEVKVEPPSDWEEVYRLVKEMRISGPAANAAVDTMGCERLASNNASARDRRFHTLVALMLSSQTKDTVNAEAMLRLKKELPPHTEGAEPGLNLENMLAVEPTLLNELIGKVGFHNNKTKYLKQAAEILRDRYNSDIPDTIEGLMSLPGVGPKMAHLCMSAENGWNRVEGIGVDVHVHRITNLWGWQNPPTKTPEETRLALQSWLPRDKWKEINWLLVGFGQSVCLPVGRKCGDCELGLRGLCKSAERKKVIEGRKRREVVKEEKVEVEIEEDRRGMVIKREKRERKVKVKEEQETRARDVVNEPVPPAVREAAADEDVKMESTEDVEMEDADEAQSGIGNNGPAIVKHEGDTDIKPTTEHSPPMIIKQEGMRVKRERLANEKEDNEEADRQPVVKEEVPRVKEEQRVHEVAAEEEENQLPNVIKRETGRVKQEPNTHDEEGESARRRRVVKRESQRDLSTVKQELGNDEQEDDLQPQSVKPEHPRVKREFYGQGQGEEENHRPRTVKRESLNGATIVKREPNLDNDDAEDRQARSVKREPLLERVSVKQEPNIADGEEQEGHHGPAIVKREAGQVKQEAEEDKEDEEQLDEPVVKSESVKREQDPVRVKREAVDEGGEEEEEGLHVKTEHGRVKVEDGMARIKLER